MILFFIKKLSRSSGSTFKVKRITFQGQEDQKISLPIGRFSSRTSANAVNKNRVILYKKAEPDEKPSLSCQSKSGKEKKEKMLKIVGVIDMDGYRAQGIFHCKEMAIVDERGETKTFYFKDTIERNELTVKEKNSINYVTKYIHGLPYGPRTRLPGQLPAEKIDDVLKSFYMEKREKNKHCVLAYKGGNVESDILERLNIPCIDLEDYGCPTVTKLLSDTPEKFSAIEDCGEHILMVKKVNHDARKHCPTAEVNILRIWVKENITIEDDEIFIREDNEWYRITDDQNNHILDNVSRVSDFE